jgi:diguanylate cyclase (GGDEF)-like protein
MTTPARTRPDAAETPTAAGRAETLRNPDGRTAAPAAFLVFAYPAGPAVGNRYPLGDGPTYIGRQEDCAVRSADVSVSRYHAGILRREDGEYVIFDLGSMNGTFVNDRRGREAVLRDGDELRVGNCIYRFLAGEDVEAEYREEVYRLTTRDGLTRVSNRRHLHEVLVREAARGEQHARPLSLVLFAIDHFEAVNVRFGRLAGDTTLRELCTRVRVVLRRDELLARFGGDEFAVVVPEAGPEEAREAAERIRAAIEKQPFAYCGRAFSVTISLGVAVTCPAEPLGVDELIARAVASLDKAKEAGLDAAVVG